MKIAVVSASHRENSQSEKIANYLQATLSELSTASGVISLAGNPLPLWDEDLWSQSEKWKDLWTPFSEQLSAAEGFIFVVPEWGGMVPPGFKNFLLLCSTELAHKPALIVAVSSGVNGGYPISELRMSGYKNNHVCYMPSQLIIRNSEKVLNGDSVNLSLQEDKLRERILHELKLLKVYSEAFRLVRTTTGMNINRYPYGM